LALANYDTFNFIRVGALSMCYRSIFGSLEKFRANLPENFIIRANDMIINGWPDKYAREGDAKCL
jgi:hypothetical protein